MGRKPDREDQPDFGELTPSERACGGRSGGKKEEETTPKTPEEKAEQERAKACAEIHCLVDDLIGTEEKHLTATEEIQPDTRVSVARTPGANLDLIVTDTRRTPTRKIYFSTATDLRVVELRKPEFQIDPSEGPTNEEIWEIILSPGEGRRADPEEIEDVKILLSEAIKVKRATAS